MTDCMDIAHPLHSEVSSLSFSFLSTSDIRAISVKKIDNAVLLDNLAQPTRGGLYDPSLGPMNARDVYVDRGEQKAPALTFYQL